MSGLAKSLSKNTKESCGKPVEGSTSTVYRMCKTHGKGCQKEECVSLKIPFEDIEDVSTYEARIHKAISQAVKGTENRFHFNEFLDSSPIKDGTIIVAVFEKGTLLRDAIAKGISTNEWKDIMFQLLHALATAQRSIKGFAHNDLHTANIMLQANTTSHECTSVSAKGRRIARTPKRLVKIIDFGESYSDSFRNPVGESNNPRAQHSAMEDFAFACTTAVYDCAVYEDMKKSYPPWYAEWLEFLSRWLDPRLFINGNSSSPFLQKQHLRFSKAGRAWLREWYEDYNLLHVLDDSYFH